MSHGSATVEKYLMAKEMAGYQDVASGLNEHR